MIRTSFRTILLVVAGALTTQGVFAQTPGIPQHEAIHMSAPTGGASAISGGGSANPGTGSGVPVAIPAKKYDALLARERETLGQVVDVHNDFYPSDEFLHILASPGRKPLISAPFNAKSKAEAVRAAIPGAANTTGGRLYRSDSSITSLVDWYTREYGFDFKIARSPFSEGAPGDTLTVARAVKRMNNTIVTVMIWNPTSTGGGRGKKAKPVGFGGKSSVEIQEMAFRPRGELIVEGPDAVVEFTWKVPYRDLIQKISVRYQLDPYLLAALVQQESGFNAGAMSVDSAMGLTQMIPATAEALGVTNPNDPHQSIDGGARYLKMMLKRFNGNAEFALAAYNAGPGNVEKYHGIPPFAETRDYVKRIVARYKEKAGGKLAASAKILTKS